MGRAGQLGAGAREHAPVDVLLGHLSVVVEVVGRFEIDVIGKYAWQGIAVGVLMESWT